ncbi:hypothetical protein AB5I41_09250 [Sphingomonas sp. MMS24-JH45]
MKRGEEPKVDDYIANPKKLIADWRSRPRRLAAGKGDRRPGEDLQNGKGCQVAEGAE